MPQVSVIITTHSRPGRLPHAVESATKAGKDVEVIVVDDASTDGTAETCRRLKGIKYIRNDVNLGTAGARNVGIEVSAGDYISFHDDDDRKLPGSLDELVELLDHDSSVGLAYGRAWAGTDDLEPTGDPFPETLIQGDVFWRLIEANFIPTITAVFRKSCLSEIGMLDTSIPGVDDYDLWIRIAEKFQVMAIERPLGIWRVSMPNSGQGSSNRVTEAMRTNAVSHRALTSLSRALEDTVKNEKARVAVDRRTAELLFWTASENYREGHISALRASLLAGLKVDWRQILRPRVLRMAIRAALPARSI